MLEEVRGWTEFKASNKNEKVELSEAEKITINYSMHELDDMIESAERHMVRTNDSAEKAVWRDRLGTYTSMRNKHQDFRRKNR